MPLQSTNADLLRRKRELRLQIGRSRRRLSGQLSASRSRLGQLGSWRTYVARYPAWAVVAALGAGMAAAAGLKPRRLSRRLGLDLLRQAFDGFKRQLWAELRRIWTESPPDK